MSQQLGHNFLWVFNSHNSSVNALPYSDMFNQMPIQVYNVNGVHIYINIYIQKEDLNQQGPLHSKLNKLFCHW